MRDHCSLKYHTTLPAIFGVPKYAAALNKVAQEKGCDVSLRSNLVEVKGETKEAVFENLETGELTIEPVCITVELVCITFKPVCLTVELVCITVEPVCITVNMSS